MLYNVLKFIARIGLWVFFRKFEVRNRHLMDTEGPLLVVSNHPNTFMDPIVTATLLRQQVYFITKSTVFSTPFRTWLLQHMNLVPIHRREDNPDLNISNEETFKACFKALRERKSLLIFPEGNSFNERRLRKIKTGTARIALGVEATSHQPLGVRILPVGLNYSDPTRFRSDLFVNVGNPIDVASFLPAYNTDPTAAVKALTDHIRQQLEKLIIVTASDEEDELVRNIEEIYRTRLAAGSQITAPEHEHHFLLTKSIVKGLSYFNEVAPELLQNLKQQISDYRLQLNRLRLQDAVLRKGHTKLLRHSIRMTIFLLLCFPLYLYGLLNNYLPYIIPSKVAKRLTEAQEFMAPIMMTVGIFSFPLFYLLQSILFWHLVPNLFYLLLYMVSLPVSGFFTLQYWNTFERIQDHWLLLKLFLNRSTLLSKLREQREKVLIALEEARMLYLQKLKKE
ncbi:lysophospholipid acyltransferase family protein [Botryobacter ruber]|uniref:lysophospholipid acyltransferase family protein n=1 Tax=Botryobacter ruber TaxID=2171629 RepID=UPI000E0A81C8|nr:lysophospholipid acyltransferase family protein [Botryobacter ruber]